MLKGRLPVCFFFPLLLAMFSNAEDFCAPQFLNFDLNCSCFVPFHFFFFEIWRQINSTHRKRKRKS